MSAEDAVFRAEEHMCFHWKYSDTGEYTPMHVIEDLARKYYRGSSDMNENIKAAAWDLRVHIECNSDGYDTIQALLRLVQELGGNDQIMLDMARNDKPQLLVSYLFALLLTQE